MNVVVVLVVAVVAIYCSSSISVLNLLCRPKKQALVKADSKPLALVYTTSIYKDWNKK